MKTTKIKATATEKTVTTITLEIDGKKLNITREDAKAVYDELSKVFGPKLSLMLDDPISPWNQPIWSPVIPNPFDKPWTITC